jgi:hypothetical protein
MNLCSNVLGETFEYRGVERRIDKPGKACEKKRRSPGGV